MAKDSNKLVQKINFELSKPQFVAFLEPSEEEKNGVGERDAETL